MFPLEVPVFSPHSASLALAQHASRVELNRDGSYPEGGLTPTIADLQSLTTSHKDVSSPPQAAVRVMIRPRGPPPPQSPPAPDFLYSEAEFEEMKKAVGDFKASGCINVERGDGFVFGCLKEGKMGGNGGKGSVVVVDIARNTELVELAKPFPAVFHRAFVSDHTQFLVCFCFPLQLVRLGIDLVGFVGQEKSQQCLYLLFLQPPSDPARYDLR